MSPNSDVMWAYIAHDRPLGYFKQSYMNPQLSSSDKPFPTYVAFIILLSCVSFHMTRQLDSLSKPFPTHIAFIFLLSSVSFHMLSQMGSLNNIFQIHCVHDSSLHCEFSKVLVNLMTD